VLQSILGENTRCNTIIQVPLGPLACAVLSPKACTLAMYDRLKLLFGWKDVAESAFPGKVKCAVSRKATVRQSDYTDVIKDVRNRFLQVLPSQNPLLAFACERHDTS